MFGSVFSLIVISCIPSKEVSADLKDEGGCVGRKDSDLAAQILILQSKCFTLGSTVMLHTSAHPLCFIYD